MFESPLYPEFKDNYKIVSLAKRVRKHLQQNQKEENFPKLNEEMTIKVQEACRTPNTLDQKRNFSYHIIIKTLNKEHITKKEY